MGAANALSDVIGAATAGRMVLIDVGVAGTPINADGAAMVGRTVPIDVGDADAPTDVGVFLLYLTLLSLSNGVDVDASLDTSNALIM